MRGFKADVRTVNCIDTLISRTRHLEKEHPTSQTLPQVRSELPFSSRGCINREYARRSSIMCGYGYVVKVHSSRYGPRSRVPR